MFHLTAALEEVHNAGVYHRDIKLENVLVDKHFELKICDFGSCCEASVDQSDASFQKRAPGNANEIFGTAAYNAPEVHAGGACRFFDKCDVFSLGCCLFLLVSWSVTKQAFRQQPFKQAKRDDPFFRLLQTGPKDEYWKLFSKTTVSDDLKGCRQF